MSSTSNAFSTLPIGRAPAPVAVPHFPDVLHTVVWRNWDVIDVSVLAKVLKGTPAQITKLAQSMGLPPQRQIPPAELRRNYISILRRNWHLLPYEQLCELLNWDVATMQFELYEDDGLYTKLGAYKPQCPPVHYGEPTAAGKERAAEIARIVRDHFGEAFHAPSEPPYGFIERFNHAASESAVASDSNFKIRMVYPYFLRFGDPLINDGIDDIPEGYLAELAASGINSIWLLGVLYTLAPWSYAPTLSTGWEKRLANLNRLVERCKKFGMEVLLYINEPRAMPRPFFDKYPELRGVEETPGRRAAAMPDVLALCTSTQPVQDFLVNSVRHVFERVPGLGGIFTITYSENLTNCYSRRYEKDGVVEEFLLRKDTSVGVDEPITTARACPRCAQRGPETISAEVLQLIDRGMREAGSKGKLILYVWSTPEDWMPGIMDRLPAGTWIQCVSEWGKTFTRGDYTGKINEYSISVIGPSEQSLRQWKMAQERGLKKIAKMQAANTFEISSMPYIPALRNVAQHLWNVTEAGVDGVTLGWTAGGSPSPNLELVAEFGRSPRPSVDEALLNVANRRFGAAAAAEVVRAWDLLSEAYCEFPFDIDVCYNGPQSTGPANLLFAEPSGFVATLVGFPFDDLDGWRGPYSAETFLNQFEKLADRWQLGVDVLNGLRKSHPSSAMEDEWRIAEACRIHFRSTANQIKFIRARGHDGAVAKAILKDEITLARKLFDLVAQDSRIGFEATNQYSYIRFDLAEKILNCVQLLERFEE